MLSIFKKKTKKEEPKIEIKPEPKPIWDLKSFLKKTAAELRIAKQGFKTSFKNDRDETTWSYHGTIFKLKRLFRSYHIAYCEIRGKKREYVERPAKDNPPDEKLITQAKSEYYLPVRRAWLSDSNTIPPWWRIIDGYDSADSNRRGATDVPRDISISAIPASHGDGAK